MAERKNSEAEKVMSQNPEKKVVGAETEPEKMAKPYRTEDSEGTQAKPWFQPKAGSVFPAKRKLIKRMVFDSIVQSFPVFSTNQPSSTDDFEPDGEGDSSKRSENKNSKEIHPYPSYD